MFALIVMISPWNYSYDKDIAFFTFEYLSIHA